MDKVDDAGPTASLTVRDPDYDPLLALTTHALDLYCIGRQNVPEGLAQLLRKWRASRIINPFATLLEAASPLKPL